MVYQKLVDLVESNGGTMKHEREGHPSGGVWIFTFEGKSRTLEGNGKGSYTELDQLYRLKSHVKKASHHSDYTNDLLDDAWLLMKSLIV